MPSPNDGGPIFAPITHMHDPMTGNGYNVEPSDDALRFEAAKCAMQGILARVGTEVCTELVATWAVQNADALIAELSKPSKGGS